MTDASEILSKLNPKDKEQKTGPSLDLLGSYRPDGDKGTDVPVVSPYSPEAKEYFARATQNDEDLDLDTSDSQLSLFDEITGRAGGGLAESLAGGEGPGGGSDDGFGAVDTRGLLDALSPGIDQISRLGLEQSNTSNYQDAELRRLLRRVLRKL